MPNSAASKTFQLLKKIFLSNIILGIMVLTFSSDATAQTPDFRSGELKAKSSLSNIDYLALMNTTDSRVVVIDHNTNTESFDLVPNFNTPSAQPYILDGMLAAAPNGNYAVGAQVQNIPRETTVNFNVSGSFDNSKRISSNFNAGYGLNAINVIDNKFVMIFRLGQLGHKIAIAADWANPLVEYNTAISGIQYAVIQSDLDGSNPALIGVLHGFVAHVADVKRNDIVHNINDNLLLKFKTNLNYDTRYIEMDKITGTILNTYDFPNFTAYDQDSATGDIYIVHKIPQASFIERYDSNMVLLETSYPVFTDITDVKATTNGLMVMETEGFVMYDKETLFPFYSPKSDLVEMPNYWNEDMENQIIQISEDGLSANISFYYTGNPENMFDYTDVTVNGIDIPDAGNSFKSVSYVKDLSVSIDSLVLNQTTDVAYIHNNSKIDSLGQIVTAKHAFVVEYHPSINLATMLDSVLDVNLLAPPSGWNTNPRAGMSAFDMNFLKSYGFATIDTTENGHYFAHVMMYNHPTGLPFTINTVERKFYRIYFKTASDIDGDLVADSTDNCIYTANPNQEDFDNDNIGDICDDDDDNDMVLDVQDAFPFDQTEWEDTDTDGTGNNADTDDDNDGYDDSVELAEGTDPLDENSTPADYDGDFIPDSTDEDIDGDGVANTEDAFPYDETETEDFDQDNIGNNADPDDDNDGYNDDVDAYPFDSTRWELETGIKNIAALEISIYPNPANDVLFINTKEKLSAIEILDALGQSIHTQNTNLEQVNLFGFAKGMYCIKISVGDHFTIKRFVKE